MPLEPTPNHQQRITRSVKLAHSSGNGLTTTIAELEVTRHLLRLITAYLLACVPIAHGTVWERHPLKKLVSDHPLIFVGEIVRVEQTSRRGEAFDIAYIRIEKILKDSLPHNAPRVTAELPLWMPSTRDETMSTDDVTHPVHASGIWFLSPSNKDSNSRRPERVFHTRHPDEVQPRKLIAKVGELLRKSQRANPTAEQTYSVGR